MSKNLIESSLPAQNSLQVYGFDIFYKGREILCIVKACLGQTSSATTPTTVGFEVFLEDLA